MLACSGFHNFNFCDECAVCENLYGQEIAHTQLSLVSQQTGLPFPCNSGRPCFLVSYYSYFSSPFPCVYKFPYSDTVITSAVFLTDSICLDLLYGRDSYTNAHANQLADSRKCETENAARLRLVSLFRSFYDLIFAFQ